MRRCRRTKINLYLSIQTSMLDSFKSNSESYISPPVLLGIGDDDPGDLLTVQEKVPFPEIVTCFSDILYKLFNISFFFPWTNHWDHSPNLNIACTGKSRFTSFQQRRLSRNHL